MAIVDGDLDLTYADFAARTNALSAALRESGVRRGDRVGIYMDKTWESVVAMVAVSEAGGAFVNINPLLKARQVNYIAQDCGLRVMVCDGPLLGAVDRSRLGAVFYRGDRPAGIEETGVDLSQVFDSGGMPSAPDNVQENDLAAILYTSGSTGLPKGVALSQRNLVVGAEIVSTYLENTAEDRILSVLPFSFDYGLSQVTTAMRVGAQLVLQRSRMPGDVLRGLRRHRITGLAGVPPVWALLLQSSRSLAADPLTELRYITNSGGRIPQPNLDELRRLLPRTQVFLMYGLTEAFRSTYLPPDQIGRGSDCMGRAVPNTDIWVVDETGRECGPGEVGELVHRGPTVALGYWANAEATNSAFRPSPFAPPELDSRERVVFSGDLVRRDEEGYLYFVGRRDALIKTQGYRVSSEEAEDVLVETGLVGEACVFGVPDAELGQALVAVVTIRDGVPASPESIRVACQEGGPPHLVPKRIVIVDELAKTGSGKIDRSAIRDAFAGG